MSLPICANGPLSGAIIPILSGPCASALATTRVRTPRASARNHVDVARRHFIGRSFGVNTTPLTFPASRRRPRAPSRASWPEQAPDGVRDVGGRANARARVRGILAGVVTVEPDARDAEFARGRDVVEPTVGDVDPLAEPGAGRAPEVVEMGRRRLVVSHALSRHHEVERRPEGALCLAEQVLIAVRENGEPMAVST